MVLLKHDQHKLLTEEALARFTGMKSYLNLLSEDVHAAIQSADSGVGVITQTYLHLLSEMNILSDALRALEIHASINKIDSPFCIHVFTEVLHLPTVWTTRKTIIPQFLGLLALQNFSESMSSRWYLDSVVFWARKDDHFSSTLDEEDDTPPVRAPDLPRFPEKRGSYSIEVDGAAAAKLASICRSVFHKVNACLSLQLVDCHSAFENHLFGDLHLESFIQVLHKMVVAHTTVHCFGDNDSAANFSVDIYTTFQTLTRIVHTKAGWGYRDNIQRAYLALLNPDVDNITRFRLWIRYNIVEWNPCNNT